jgi:hypothetical protein
MLPYFDGMTADAVLLNRSNPVLAAISSLGYRSETFP